MQTHIFCFVFIRCDQIGLVCLQTTSKNIYKCKGCELVTYCNNKCQSQDLKQKHKFTCTKWGFIMGQLHAAFGALDVMTNMDEIHPLLNLMSTLGAHYETARSSEVENCLDWK